MEIAQVGHTEEEYRELQDVVKHNLCAECNAELTIRTNPERQTLEVGCARSREHRGFVERATLTQLYRRGDAIVPVNVERRIMERGDAGLWDEQGSVERAIKILALKYPDALDNKPSAALFINDCAMLGLNPMITPAEAVPIAFKNQRTGRKQIVMLITEDGYLSMAARSAPEDWDGPPATLPLTDYLIKQPENKERPYADISQMAKETAKNVCGEADAWFWVAYGKRKSMTENYMAYGWFKQSEVDSAYVAGKLPGNQARIRAIRRWVREVYPEARSKMVELNAALRERAKGIKEAEDYIDGEFKEITEPGKTKKPPATKTPEQPQQTQQTQTTTEKPWGDITEKDVPSLHVLETLCYQFWKMQPVDVYKQLGYSSKSDCTETPWDCFVKIRAIKEPTQ